MTVLLVAHDACDLHLNWPSHPERPARMEAVRAGIVSAGVSDAVVAVEPAPATLVQLQAVHELAYIKAVQATCSSGGARLDPDTGVVPESWAAALRAAGAGPAAVERLRAGDAGSAFCAVRPPGHHALASRQMGFCLFNNVAVCAAALASQGERVLIVDWDAHHGNGTEATFYDSDRVAFVSFHQSPLWPFSGAVQDSGVGAGEGLNVNLPFPEGATGEHYLAGFDAVVAPLADRFQPTWLLVSAGFDAHRADPLTNLGLSSGDFGLLAERVLSLVPPGRRIAFLEGGYDLKALASSVGSCVAAMADVSWAAERPTAGGPGASVVDAARRQAAHFR